MLTGYRFSEKKFWADNDLEWLVSEIDITNKKCAVFGIKRRFALGELHLFIKNGRSDYRPVAIFGRIIEMDLADAALVNAFDIGVIFVSKEQCGLRKGMARDRRFRIKYPVRFFKYPDISHTAIYL